MQEREISKAQATNAKTIGKKLSELPKDERERVTLAVNAYVEGYLAARRVFAT